GKRLFEGRAGCAGCHAGPLFTDANIRLHLPGDSMAEPEATSYAARSATGLYRTTPLRGAWQHPPYFHDGSAATLEEVVAIYDRRQGLGLTSGERSDLTEYLKSL
ncbi:MAG: c-type cytochrome, partial [Rhodocyclaceae bacterium]|nr:c-type cytochrome [Rhodocyclaceae bacterium]